MDKINIKVSVFHEKANRLSGRILELLFEGKSADDSTINAIRRVILSEIPVYGISESNIIIEKNTTGGVFDNDYIRQRLSMIHVVGVKSKIKYLHNAYYPYVAGTYGLIYPPDYKQAKDPKDDLEFKININVSNKDKFIKDVTTNDMIISVNGERIENKYDKDYPACLLKLKRDQDFKCVATAVLGIGKLHSSWACVARCVKRDIDDKKTLEIEAIDYDRQLDEYEVVLIACDIIIMKLENIKETLLEQYENKKESEESNEEKIICLEIENETDTIGYLLKSAFILHNRVFNAGYSQKHPYIENINLEVKLLSGNFKKILNEVIKYLVDLYKDIISQVTKLRESSKINGVNAKPLVEDEYVSKGKKPLIKKFDPEFNFSSKK